MWLMTAHGFYSVVQHRDDSDQFLVRARVRGDLDNLKRVASIDAPIKDTPGGDYKHRLYISREQLGAMMATLTESIEYDNFKDHIHALPDQKHKSRAYMTVWSAMQETETPR